MKLMEHNTQFETSTLNFVPANKIIFIDDALSWEICI